MILNSLIDTRSFRIFSETVPANKFENERRMRRF
jgi:hypothetical protein